MGWDGAFIPKHVVKTQVKEAAMTLFLNILVDWFKLAVWNSFGPAITAGMVFINISLLKSVLLQLKYTNAPAHARIKQISFLIATHL